MNVNTIVAIEIWEMNRTLFTQSVQVAIPHSTAETPAPVALTRFQLSGYILAHKGANKRTYICEEGILYPPSVP